MRRGAAVRVAGDRAQGLASGEHEDHRQPEQYIAKLHGPLPKRTLRGEEFRDEAHGAQLSWTKCHPEDRKVSCHDTFHAPPHLETDRPPWRRNWQSLPRSKER